ncbi:MAG TPA: type I-MYXAN CRISPR-associated Cas8a1/Cmx1 [Cyanobacteria bacterium UBA8803]|nr:type I-MYXAN CRISPR-associated Cas8a1/Cmx1 [Cyanobacteria bacterium UBA9273]HBL62913.1 type I-MYXAN CRISPR-associated Cas8a1/Cmx1 [Cyanobacteria bacterium UBA8803]
MQQIEFDLGDPGFTLLHQAGLAGLWMTLKQLEQEKVSPLGKLKWQLDRRHIFLSWEGQDLEVLNWLLQESFQLVNGLISLRGLDSKSMRIESQVIVHQGMLGTFLQHTSTHKAEGTETQNFQLEDDQPPAIVTYKFLKSYVHQEFAKSLCDQKGKFLQKPMSVAGWLNPGAVVRHIAFSSSTSFEERPEQAFVLLFAPIACYYFLLRSKLRDKRAQYALIIPEVTDLEKYASYRQNTHLREASYKDFFASGLGDAGLRFLTYETTADIAKQFGVKRCQVLTLGTVAWAAQQKTRTDLYVVEANAKVCDNYRICCDWLSDRIMPGKNGSFVASSFARELIAENLAKKQPWYTGFADKINSNQLFEKLTYEKRGLYQMVQKAKWDEQDKLFVQVCHEAIKFTYGQISKNTKSGEVPNFERATVRIRTGLSRCKSSATFREFITDFWSRAGRLPTLQKHWSELMDYVTGQRNWKKARDLALLALASYKKDEVDGEDDGIDEEEEMIDIDVE